MAGPTHTLRLPPERRLDLLAVLADERPMQTLLRELRAAGIGVDVARDLATARQRFFGAGGHHCVVVGPDREIRSTGFNGFPRGIEDNEGRLSDRDQMYPLIGKKVPELLLHLLIQVIAEFLIRLLPHFSQPAISGGPSCMIS